MSLASVADPIVSTSKLQSLAPSVYGSQTSSPDFATNKETYTNLLSSLLKTMNETTSVSALEAARKATAEANAFNANQAAVAREYNSLEADKARSFNAEQALIDRQFQSEQAEINRRFQQSSAEKSMNFEAEQAQRSMDFSERMANSTYQRAVADLQKAGLSPLLAYSNLQTTAPSGVMASGSSASGSMASGSRASGSAASSGSASGFRADTSSALSVERQPMSQLLSLIALNVNTALGISGQLTNFLGKAAVAAMY